MKRLLTFALLIMGLAAAPAAAQPLPSPGPEDIERIGHALIEAAGTADAKFVLFAKYDERFGIVTIRYVPEGAKEIKPLFLKPGSVDLQQIWQASRSQPGGGWAEMVYVLDHGRVSVDLSYPDQLPAAELSRVRMEAAVAKHLGPLTR
jgi:hypothetical protein